MSEVQEPITFVEPDGFRNTLLKITDTAYREDADDATPADLIAALQQNDALRAEVLRGLYEVHGMATDHAREVGKCIGCGEEKRLTRIVPGAGKIGLCMDCGDKIRRAGRGGME